jgi:hypothetical protein
MNILDFLASNPQQLQQMAQMADPAPILAQLEQFSPTGGGNPTSLSSVINPQQPQMPIPMDPNMAAFSQMINPSVGQPPMGPPASLGPVGPPTNLMQVGPPTSLADPEAMAKAEEEEKKKKAQAAAGVNRAAELAAMTAPERTVMPGAGSPAGGKNVQIAPVFQAQGLGPRASLADLLFGKGMR